VGSGDSIPGVKRPGREADHSPPSNAEVTNARSCTSVSSICLRGVVLNSGIDTSSWRGTFLSIGAASPYLYLMVRLSEEVDNRIGWGSWLCTSQSSSVNIVTRLRTGRLEFFPRQGQWRDAVSSPPLSRLALEPTQRPIEWIPGALSPEAKRPEYGVDHSPPSNAEVKKAWSYTSTPQIRLHGVVPS
jgi:hypothetical protein